MRKSALLTAVTFLLGGCSLLSPAPAEVPREPVTTLAAPPPADTRSQQPTAPRRPQPIRIDNASIEAFRASYKELRASLSPVQQADLTDALVRLAFAQYGGAANIPGNLRSNAIVPEMVRHRIAGLTYAEIVALSQ
jgi:hypothetical protein